MSDYAQSLEEAKALLSLVHQLLAYQKNPPLAARMARECQNALGRVIEWCDKEEPDPRPYVPMMGGDS